MIATKNQFENIPIWHDFIRQYSLTEKQAAQFATYLTMVRTSNELFNLTAITEPEQIIAYHFQDSLAISTCIDLKTITMIADIGSGAGFPGIPLKIAFPHIRVELIEVSRKKIEFLESVIDALGLEDCAVCAMDWRTFLRKTDEPIDLLVSRASLHTDELMRMFKPSSPYRQKLLAYWASKEWQPGPIEKPFLAADKDYTIKSKKRRIIFFSSPLKA